MAVEEFSARARQIREAKRPTMTQQELARLSGWSLAAVRKLEGRSRVPPKPSRRHAMDLANALGWDIDEALGILDYEPLTEEELDLLPELTQTVDYWAELQRLWPKLSLAQQAAVAALAASIVDPQRPPPGVSGGSSEVVIMDASPGASARARDARRRRNNTP